MSMCRGCAGTGISAKASPREAQAAMQTIHLVKMHPPTAIAGGPQTSQQVEFRSARVLGDPAEAPGKGYSDTRDPASLVGPWEKDKVRAIRAHARVDAWETTGGGVHKGRLAMSGPLRCVIDHVNERLASGFTIDHGSLAPDPALCCEWCAGLGQAAKILTVHTMQAALEVEAHGSK